MCNSSHPGTAGFSGGPHFSAPQPESGNAHNVRTHSEPTKNQEFPRDKNTPSEHYRYYPPNCIPSNNSSHTEANRSNIGSFIEPNETTTIENSETNIVFNYSSVVLTEAMERVLKRGFNFSILPKKLDITQIFVDLKHFERSVLWKKFHHGKEDQDALCIMHMKNHYLAHRKPIYIKIILPLSFLKTF